MKKPVKYFTCTFSPGIKIQESLLVLFILFYFFTGSCKKEVIQIPDVVTLSVLQITDSTAMVGGYITDDGGSAVTSYGFVWGTEPEPDLISNSGYTTDSSNTGVYTRIIKTLIPATSYYIKAYCTNNTGTGYGKDILFKTLGDTASVTTLDATNILAYTATLNGIINPNFLSTSIAFEYGTDESYGLVAVVSPGSFSGSTDINVSACLTGIAPGTIYHYRLKAVNSMGTKYGNDVTFSTLSGKIPTVVTQEVTNLSFDGLCSVTLNGIVNPNCLVTSVTFEYGTSSSYGQTIAASPDTITADTSTYLSADLSGLLPNTTYYFRVKAVNNLGTSLGDEMTFTMWLNIPGPQVNDIDGNTYNSVKIGNQTWMTENLKVTRYRNGDSIVGITDRISWIIGSAGAYCNYDNNSILADTYGKLYNFYAVIDGRNLCPAGWHVSTEAEWTILINELGGKSKAGLYLKEQGKAHWISSSGELNSSGFTALPGGKRMGDMPSYHAPGEFIGIGYSADFWTPRSSDYTSFYHYLSSSDKSVGSSGVRKNEGCSVRCIKD